MSQNESKIKEIKLEHHVLGIFLLWLNHKRGRSCKRTQPDGAPECLHKGKVILDENKQKED